MPLQTNRDPTPPPPPRGTSNVAIRNFPSSSWTTEGKCTRGIFRCDNNPKRRRRKQKPFSFIFIHEAGRRGKKSVLIPGALNCPCCCCVTKFFQAFSFFFCFLLFLQVAPFHRVTQWWCCPHTGCAGQEVGSPVLPRRERFRAAALEVAFLNKFVEWQLEG